MSLGTRLGVLGVVLAALGGLALWIATPRPPRVPTSFQTARACKACHEDVWTEWYGSHHQIAYLNPEVRLLSDDFRNKECQACHLPRPVAITGYGKRTLPRITEPDEGVSCLSCHLDASGNVIGVRDRPQAPCAPRARPDFGSVELCASCHNQHATTDQWRASSHAKQGTDCNACHMPEVAARKGRSHVFPGAHDQAMLESAARFTAHRDGNQLVMTLENTGAGHNFPTEERHRAVDIVFRFATPEGAGEWQRAYRFRQPYRDEEGPNTQLKAGGTMTVKRPIPNGATRAEARVWYRLTPYVGDEDPKSRLLFERTIDLQ